MLRAHRATGGAPRPFPLALLRRGARDPSPRCGACARSRTRATRTARPLRGCGAQSAFGSEAARCRALRAALASVSGPAGLSARPARRPRGRPPAARLPPGGLALPRCGPARLAAGGQRPRGPARTRPPVVGRVAGALPSPRQHAQPAGALRGRRPRLPRDQTLPLVAAPRVLSGRGPGAAAGAGAALARVANERRPRLAGHSWPASRRARRCLARFSLKEAFGTVSRGWENVWLIDRRIRKQDAGRWGRGAGGRGAGEAE